MPMLPVEGLSRLIEVVLVGSGFALVLRDVVQSMLRGREAKRPDVLRSAEQGMIEKAILNLKSANDEFAADVTRVRAANTELELKAREREEWWQHRWDERETWRALREAEMQSEIDSMRNRMVELIRELDLMRDRLDRVSDR